MSDIRVEWHQPDNIFAAVLLRDGAPWYLHGALVGTGPTWAAAVEDLTESAKHLVMEGENFLTDAPLPIADRRWLADMFDRGNDLEAIQQRYDAMRAATQ